VTDFVASQEMDPQYSQPVWPASAGGPLPTLRPPPEDAYRALERLSPRLPHRSEEGALGLPTEQQQQRLSPMPPARKVGVCVFLYKFCRVHYAEKSCSLLYDLCAIKTCICGIVSAKSKTKI
jgi:hypothetical protein